MTPIEEALNNGYSEEDVLSFISKYIPKLKKPIGKSLNAGYHKKQVLSFLSNVMQRDFDSSLSQFEAHGKRLESERQASRGLAKYAASAFGSLALSRAIAPLAQKGSEFLKRSAKDIISLNPINPSQASQSPLEPSNEQNQSLPQTEKSTPETTYQAPLSSVQILNEMNLVPQIESLKQAGNTPEAISAAIGIGMKPGARKWLDEQIKAGKAKPLADMVSDYLSEGGQRVQAKQTLDSITPEFKDFLKSKLEAGEPERPIEEMRKEFEKSQKVSPMMKQMGEDVSKMEEKLGKGHLVAAPGGHIGSVKEIRNGKALIDEDGKLHQFDENELIPSPLPEKDLADLYEDLIQGIEKETKEEVSRNVNIAAYNPNTNRLLYQPHAGGFYIYGNIPQEEASSLQKFLSSRKSTGQNFIGAWKEGTKSPIGAAMSSLIRRLQEERGGKGKEYEERFEIIYDALRPAIEAAKKRKKNGKK